MSRFWTVAVAVMVLGFGVGCSQKDPAQQAIDQAEEALYAVSEPALKYIPDQYAEAKTQLDRARQAFAAGRYGEALNAAADLPARAHELGAAASAARQQLVERITPDWDRLAGDIPRRLAELGERIRSLQSGGGIPQGMKPDAIAQADKGLELAQRAFEQATSSHAEGDIEAAVARARACDLLLVKLLDSLGVPQHPVAGAAN